MRTIVYFSSVLFVATSVLCGLVTELLTLYGVSFPYRSFLSDIKAFGFLAPRMVSLFLPTLVLAVLEFATVLLLLRRMWLLVVKKEGVPPSFRGIQQTFGYLGMYSILLIPLLLTILRGGGYFFGALLALLLIPSVFFIFGAFILTEVCSFRWSSLKHRT